MPFGFSFNEEVPRWTIEVYVGNAMTQQRTIQAPDQIMVMQYISMVNEVSQAPQPMKIILYGTKQIQSSLNEWINRPARLEFYNNKWDGDM